MTTRKEPRGGQTSAAGILRHDEDTSTLAQIQDAAIESASEVREIEERCLSAIYRGLPGSYDVVIDVGLTDSAMFAFPEHATIYRVLMSAGIIFRNKPSIGVIRAALADEFDLHFEHRVGWAGEWNELAEILLCECSAAGLDNYSRLIIKAARRRAQVLRLWQALKDRAADPFGEGRKRRTSSQAPSWRPPENRQKQKHKRKRRRYIAPSARRGRPHA